MHSGIYRECRESGKKEEFPSSLLDLAECLLALCSSSSACQVDNLISVLSREESDSRTFAEHASNISGGYKITNAA